MPNLFSQILLGAIIAGLVEISLSATWNPLYFKIGIPVFFRRYRTVGRLDLSRCMDKLESRFQEGSFPSLEFRMINPGLCAFKEELILWEWRRRRKIRYTPVMHGALRYRPDEQSVTVVGYLNWSIILAWLLSTWFILNTGSETSLLIFLSVLIGLFFVAQVYLYNQVGQFASKYLD